MHAEPAVMTEQCDDTESQTQTEVAERKVVAGFFGIMDVLMPATPPQPKNARIVRQFDLEAAKTDARPEAEPAPAGRARPERRSRAEARAFRNRSLRAAAGLD